MVESPAINRENYIVFKAITHVEGVNEKAPIVLAKYLEPVKRPSQEGMSFSGCYANLKGRSRSVVLPSWVDFTVGWRNNSYFVDSSFPQFPVSVHNDASYEVPNAEILRVISPWIIQINKPEIDWIAAKSLYNKTILPMPSGYTAFDENSPGIPFFVYIPRIENFEAFVPLNHPINSFYPLSDLPIHVESYYDPSLMQRLSDQLLKSNDERPFAQMHRARKLNEKKTCPQNLS